MKIFNNSIKATFAVSMIYLLVISCNSKEPKTASYYANYDLHLSSALNDTQSIINIDTLKITHPDGVGKGFSRIVNGELVFFDLLRTEVRRITNEFELGEYLLTKGDGPNQIPSFQSFGSSANQNLLLSSWTVFKFYKDLN